MRLKSGLRILEETTGEGPEVEAGDLVSFDVQESLSRGDVIQDRLTLERRVGDRRIMAGLEYSLYGMRPGGYRRVRVSPHLAYRDRGVPGKIPPDAVLILDIWVHAVLKRSST